ncbi:CBL-interacting serine/threonine-protein kinase 4 [Datura stramonium]|uniref:CBL-interacting serine/threonine-protein kinase 4 n=1 Tax=Datura stramonium TaxID=4076 RepID=A0ABS8VN29_DATST|nr:CBL-interacting serine/threonine-protein kinase 4 [Datura stramonium]
MSSGLDYLGYSRMERARKRWGSRRVLRSGDVEEKVMKIGEEGGYKVEREKGGGSSLVKGRVALMVEILEVAMELLLVELRLLMEDWNLRILNGKELKFVGMKDIVVSCYNDRS